MISLSFEEVDDYPEIKNTEFGFNGFSGVIRNEENVIVGFFTIDVDEPVIDLQEIEILEEHQGKGYGTMFISELFKKYPKCEIIEGKSLEDAVSFYAKFENVEWHSTCDDCDCIDCSHNKEDEEDEEDESDFDTCDDFSDNLFKIKRVNKN